jgi:phosphopantothenoylcysteine decarboxylase/phosphopantothenate--cysteine ligase
MFYDWFFYVFRLMPKLKRGTFMQGKTLVLGVTGGIAVYKVPDLISRLRKKGLNIEVIMTRAATEFVTPLTFREISQNPVHIGMFDEPTEWHVQHIALAKKAAGLAIIPATANIIGKLANGIADDLLTTTVMAATCPKLIAPAMNTAMYQNAILQKNLVTLVREGVTVVYPESGQLLCGDSGIGKLAALDEIELYLEKLLTPSDLAGETVLITAGGTREPIDPIRYLTNRSSGKMGHALALAAWKRGAQVILVTAAELPIPNRDCALQVCRVATTIEMLQAVQQYAPQASIVIKAAAPADFRPETVATEKIKKQAQELTLKLTPNPDILAELGRTKQPNQLLVGFAAETSSLAEQAKAKLQRKNLDLIVANLVNRREVGMGAATNRVTIYSRQDAVELPEEAKPLLADKILSYIIKYQREQVLN